jgi:ethanolamine utilization protein EutN
LPLQVIHFSDIGQDIVGAGLGELVIVVQGNSARVATGDSAIPVDAVIVGILDSLLFDCMTTFKKR